MSVTRRDSLRRWSLVGAGLAVLCALPALVAAWPAPTAANPGPAELRERILASTGRPHQGYASTDGRLGLPPLPQLAGTGLRLGGSARVRTWYAGPEAWRVAELTLVGERDVYRTAAGRYQWDYELNLVTLLVGEPSGWLPGVADLVPPELARRLLSVDGRLEPLPARWVAGVGAAGVRLVPADPDTTVGRVDVWADPASGLPVRVEVAGRDGADPAFTSRFLQLRQEPPDPAVLEPPAPPGAEWSVLDPLKLGEVLAQALPGELPRRLAGRPRTSAPAGLAAVNGGAVYGSGLSTLVVVGLPGRLGGQTVGTAEDAGTPVRVPGADAYRLGGSLLSALVVHADHPAGDRPPTHTWLLAGLVDPEVLRQAAVELVAQS
jgi:hypothetical protein